MDNQISRARLKLESLRKDIDGGKFRNIRQDYPFYEQGTGWNGADVRISEYTPDDMNKWYNENDFLVVTPLPMKCRGFSTGSEMISGSSSMAAAR